MGEPVQRRPGPVANLATPLLTAALPSDPSTGLPNPRRQEGRDCPLPPSAPVTSPSCANSGPQHLPTVAADPSLEQMSGIGPHSPVPSPLIPDPTSHPASLRWIRAKTHYLARLFQEVSPDAQNRVNERFQRYMTQDGETKDKAFDLWDFLEAHRHDFDDWRYLENAKAGSLIPAYEEFQYAISGRLR